MRHTPHSVMSDPAAHGLDLDEIFDYGHYVRHVPEILERLPS